MMTLADRGRKLNFQMTGDQRVRLEPLPRLWLVSDPRQSGLEDSAGRFPPGGGVLLRHYNDPERYRLAVSLRAICRSRGLKLVIAGDITLADQVKADGLHLPEGMARHGLLSRALLWRRARSGRFLSVAAHSKLALSRVAALGVDIAFLSPVFPTQSHPEARVLGTVRFERMVREARIPVVALGGITSATVRRLENGGAWGVAAVSGWSVL